MEFNLEIENKINNYLWGGRQLKWQNWNKFINSNSIELQYLKERYKDSRTLKESAYRLKYNIEQIPVCPVCGNFNNFIAGKKLYTAHCSCVCTQLDKNVRNKNKDTNLKLYGVDNGAKSQQAKEKYIKHIREKYNDDSITNAFQSKEVIQKIKDTTLKRYGVTNYALLPEHQRKLTSKEVVNKRIETKRKNHTFNTSKIEINSYNLLKTKYIDTLYQYKSNEYPYSCDFYIPSLKLYIECNYHWTHGGHPFNESDDNDIKLLNIWKEKHTKYYNNAIQCWTIRDVNKRNIAIKNNLNYIEFWNFDELKNWIENN